MLLRLFVSALGLSIALTTVPASASAADGIADLASGDFERVVRGVGALGASTDERALPILEALEAGKLVACDDGSVAIADGSKLAAVPPGSPLAASCKRRVDVNNRVRRTLDRALATLRISSKDPDTRRTAAVEVAKSPTEDLLEVLRSALAKETDAKTAEAMRRAVARLDLASEDVERKVAALRAIEDSADLTFKPEVSSLAANESLLSREPRLRKAVETTLRAIEAKVFFINILANSLYGVSLGSVLLLAALGLAITFGLMRVINMAHGEMLMLGAYATFAVQRAFAAFAPSLAEHYLFVAVPVAFATSGLVGMLVERFVVRRLYGRPLETLLATWGISLILIQTVRLVFGAQNVSVANPPWLSGGIELMPNLVLPYSRIFIIFFSLAIVGGVAGLLLGTDFGLRIRAVTQNRAMAASLGVPAERVDLLTFGLGSGLAGLGGVALSQLGNVGPELGQNYIVDSFMVVVLGGVGKLVGTILGALGLGLLNKYLEPAFGAVLGKIVILGLIVLFLQRRPQGLFALKGRSAEAL